MRPDTRAEHPDQSNRCLGVSKSNVVFRLPLSCFNVLPLRFGQNCYCLREARSGNRPPPRFFWSAAARELSVQAGNREPWLHAREDAIGHRIRPHICCNNAVAARVYTVSASGIRGEEIWRDGRGEAIIHLPDGLRHARDLLLGTPHFTTICGGCHFWSQ